MIEVKSMESSSMVSSAICSPSILPEPLSHLDEPTQKASRILKRVEVALEKCDVDEACKPKENKVLVEVAEPVRP